MSNTIQHCQEGLTRDVSVAVLRFYEISEGYTLGLRGALLVLE